MNTRPLGCIPPAALMLLQLSTSRRRNNRVQISRSERCREQKPKDGGEGAEWGHTGAARGPRQKEGGACLQTDVSAQLSLDDTVQERGGGGMHYIHVCILFSRKICGCLIQFGPETPKYLILNNSRGRCELSLRNNDSFQGLNFFVNFLFVLYGSALES